jgi:sarcosine oxidase subunit beta
LTASDQHGDVIVVGGGLHGCSTALHLARKGLRPIVLEQAHTGRHASGVNAGGVRRLGRHPAEIPLSVASMAIWRDIAALVDDDCGFHRTGQIKVAENQTDMEVLAARAKALRDLGFTHEEPIGRDELRALVPAVSPHCVGALISRDDGHANPFQTVTAFRLKAEKLGVRFRQGARAERIERTGNHWTVETGASRFEAPVLVNCAGAWADRIAAQLGEAAPLRVEAPMLMITERVAPFLRPVIGAASRPLSFKQFDNGTVLIGGGHRGRADRDASTTELDFAGLAVSARTAADIFPLMRCVRVVRCWAGIEAVMPDEIPVIGPSATAADAYHAFGFSAHGFQLGPIVGRLLAELIVDGRTDLPIDPFRISRFNASA